MKAAGKRVVKGSEGPRASAGGEDAQAQRARIGEYQRAVRAMQRGRFDWIIPVDVRDDVGVLGEELAKLAKHLEARFEDANRLRLIAEEIAGGLFLEDVLERVYDRLHSMIPYDRIGCALLSEDNGTLTACWARTSAPQALLGPGFSASMATSSLREVLSTGRPRIINDLQAYLAEHPDSAATRLIVAEGVRSSLTCPLVAQGKPVGFLFFSSVEKNTYRNLHQGIFMQIAGQLSVLVEKSRLYRQLHEINQKLLRAQRQLEIQATRDALTGVFNRGAIVELLHAEIARAQRGGRPAGVILLDVDRFKAINDTHGHPAGDEVLSAVAGRLAATLRGYDHVGRFGGEEFLVVLGDAGFETAARAADRLRTAIECESVRFGASSLPVTISAGVAVAAHAASVKAEALIAAADRAMYEAKAAGRNRVVSVRL